MPVIPSVLDRLLFRFNLAPAPMLDFLGAQAFRAASAGVRLGLFDALGASPASAVEVAQRIGADPRGTAILLDALDVLGYVTKRDGGYSRSAATTKWLPLLSEGMPFLHRVVFEHWDTLEETIRNGGPDRTAYERFGDRPDAWREFQDGMSAIARMTAAQVVAKVRIPGAVRRLLDIGGGHGLYSVAFCQRHAELTATIFDLAPALSAARETITAVGMSERITLQEGDFCRDELPENHDVALFFNILHGLQAQQNRDLLRKTAEALRHDGLVVILDQLADAPLRSPTARAVARLNGLNLFNASGGQAYAGA